MKDLNIVIDCQNKEQALDVIDTFKNMGYEQHESIDGSLIVRVMEGYVFDMNWEPKDYDERLDYEAFKHKFKSNKMIELINKAKSELKMNDSELSLALGKSRQYIGKMLRLPQSKKVQDKVIKEISEFMEKVKNPNKQNVVLGDLELIDCDELSALRFQNNQAKKEISDLKKANEQQKLVIDKLDDQLIKAEKIHNEDVKLLNAKEKMNEALEGELEQSRRETDYFVNQFKCVEDELKELKSSHTTSKSLNWFFVVAIILAVIVWKAYNG